MQLKFLPEILPNHLADAGVDGWIILRWISRNWAGGTWTGLSWLRRDRWQALVNAVLNLQAP